jgi:hypothetical protein
MASGFVMVRFKRGVPPGGYAANWHMVSVPGLSSGADQLHSFLNKRSGVHETGPLSITRTRRNQGEPGGG